MEVGEFRPPVVLALLRMRTSDLPRSRQARFSRFQISKMHMFDGWP